MDYEAKKQLKIERLEKAARLCALEADRMDKCASDMASVIPMGQPILVGHYSEGRDRNYRARIDRTWRKASDLRERAATYARRASSARSNAMISSDDPGAPDKLRAKIVRLQAIQEKMKAANAGLRKKDDAALTALGFTPEQIAKLKTPDYCGRIGFPGFMLTNNGANIRRLQERIIQLEKKSTDQTETIEKNGVRIVDNVEENRLQMFFPGKPARGVIQELKRSGFRWTPTAGCWQRYRSGEALYKATRVLELVRKEEKPNG